jgi:hypothetical protein
VADNKQEESFRVIDRRPFTSEGELRPDVVAEQEKESHREEVKEVAKEKANAAAASASTDKPAMSAGETPKKSPAFENLVRMIGSNAAMVLGACGSEDGPARDRSGRSTGVDRYARCAA